MKEEMRRSTKQLGNSNNNFDQLLPANIRFLLFRFWPIILAIQWIVVISGSFANDTFFSLNVDYPTSSRVVPFAKDFFFIIWNILPFALAFCTWIIEKGVGNVAARTQKDKRSKASTLLDESMSYSSKVFAVAPVILLACSVAILGSIHQFVKVGLWAESKACVYWWQAQFSSIIFYVRLATLFFNLIFLIIDLAILILLLVAFAKLARARLWRLDLLHIDSCGGVGEYGRTALAFTMIPFLVATCGLLGYFDHKSAGMFQTLGDTVMIILATSFGALTFILPLRPIHKEMQGAKRAAYASIEMALETLGSLLPPSNGISSGSEYFRELKGRKENREALVEIYRMYRKAPTWPINLAIGTRITGTVAGPFLVFIIDQIKTYISS